jgi:predicted phage-related endonuclease
MATGIKEDVDANTQRLFDAGHASEAAAREIAEDILCDGLSPVAGTTDDGYLTASFDGLTFDGRVGFEHKLHRDDLAAAVRAEELPEEYKIQMDQQILVGGLDYVLFMCSDGTRDKCVSMEYRSTPERAKKLLAAWKQFDADLAAYQHVEAAPEVTAAPQMALPALSIQVNGSISLIDNLEVFGRKLTDFIAGLPAKPATDQEFADADAAVKTLKTAEEALDSAESSALAQTASIDQMRRTVGLYRDQARTARLMLDKLVKARKESIRVEIMQEGQKAIDAHVEMLNKRIGKPWMPRSAPDFAGSIKGKKLLSALRDAVESELARCKIIANESADRIQINLDSLIELARQPNADYSFLFSDAQQLVTTKANDDLVLVIRSRIADHIAAEAKKLEAIKEAARIEAEKNAAAKVKAADEVAAQAPITLPVPANRSPEPAAPATPTHKGITGSARLLDRLDDLARQMTERELSNLCIHADHILSLRKAAA